MIYLGFPYSIDGRGRTALAGEAQHVRNLIEQLLFTHPGERVNRPDFGSGLLQLLFAPNSAELAAALQFTVQAGLQQHLASWIELDSVEVGAEDSSLRVVVNYRLLSDGRPRSEEFTREA